MNRRKHRPQTSRIVGYEAEGEFSERAMERLLEAAKLRGEVLQYDAGRGTFVWFNGTPGPKLRAIRKAVLALVRR